MPKFTRFQKIHLKNLNQFPASRTPHWRTWYISGFCTKLHSHESQKCCKQKQIRDSFLQQTIHVFFFVCWLAILLLLLKNRYFININNSKCSIHSIHLYIYIHTSFFPNMVPSFWVADHLPHLPPAGFDSKKKNMPRIFSRPCKSSAI